MIKGDHQFGNIISKKVTNKRMSKLAVKVMRHRSTPDLRPKFDLIL